MTPCAESCIILKIFRKKGAFCMEQKRFDKKNLIVIGAVALLIAAIVLLARAGRRRPAGKH